MTKYLKLTIIGTENKIGGKNMGVASLVLGIISIIIGFIPLCGSIALLPAIIGLILGIVDLVQKSKNGGSKGISIAGLILSIIAIIVIVFWVFIFSVAASQVDWNDLNNIQANITLY